METTEEDNKKAARKEYMKKYRAENAEALKKKTKKYYSENSEVINEKHRKFYAENAESIIERTGKYRFEKVEYYKENYKKYYAKNAESIKDKTKKYTSSRLKTDPIFRMVHNMRCRLNKFFKFSNIKKLNKTSVMVGCTREFLMCYLEQFFKEGMTRENHGVKGWHVDHIIPLSSAKSEEEAKKLCHYTNLQPLWWWENLSKSDKIG